MGERRPLAYSTLSITTTLVVRHPPPANRNSIAVRNQDLSHRHFQDLPAGFQVMVAGFAKGR
jgi:hypothetical protein